MEVAVGKWETWKENVKIIVGIVAAVIITFLLIGVFGAVAIRATTSTAPDLANDVATAINSLARSLNIVASIAGIIVILALILGIPAIRKAVSALVS